MGNNVCHLGVAVRAIARMARECGVPAARASERGLKTWRICVQNQVRKLLWIIARHHGVEYPAAETFVIE